MQNSQAQAAGARADEIIKNLANPAQAIETEHATVEVLDKAKPVVTEPVTEPAPAGDSGNWENRFKGLKASQDKTIHSLRQRVEQFDLMDTENKTLKQKLVEARDQIPTTPNEMLELFSQEEVDGFNKMVNSRVSGLENEVERLQGELTQVKEAEELTEAKNAHQLVVDAVSGAVPNYHDIDSNPAFGKWINGTDDYGNNRYDQFMRAKHSTPPDIGRLVQFYSDFAKQEVPAQEEQRKQFTQQELLQNPTSTSTDGQEAPQSLGIVWDTATISQFYKDKALNKISPARAAELEADMYGSKGK